MAKSTIFENIIIDNPDDVDSFLDAIEDSEKQSSQKSIQKTEYAIPKEINSITSRAKESPGFNQKGNSLF